MGSIWVAHALPSCSHILALVILFGLWILPKAHDPKRIANGGSPPPPPPRTARREDYFPVDKGSVSGSELMVEEMPSFLSNTVPRAATLHVKERISSATQIRRPPPPPRNSSSLYPQSSRRVVPTQIRRPANAPPPPPPPPPRKRDPTTTPPCTLTPLRIGGGYANNYQVRKLSPPPPPPPPRPQSRPRRQPPQPREECRALVPLMSDKERWVADRIPWATSAERARFLKARNGNPKAALKQLQQFMEWKQQHDPYQHQAQSQIQDPYMDTDLANWIVASTAALTANQEYRGQVLPRIVQSYTGEDGEYLTDFQGYRLLHILPAQIDERLCSLPTYALAIALYLDRSSGRDSMAKATLLVDLRGGRGWRNMSGVKLLPFVRNLASLLSTMFPERLHKCLLFPLPSGLVWAWNVVKKVLDPVTAQKVCIIQGGADQNAKLPANDLAVHMDKRLLFRCEDSRFAAFTA